MPRLASRACRSTASSSSPWRMPRRCGATSGAAPQRGGRQPGVLAAAALSAARSPPHRRHSHAPARPLPPLAGRPPPPLHPPPRLPARSKAIELAALPDVSHEERRRMLNFVICGGGPTGVETAAELMDLVSEDIAHHMPQIKVGARGAGAWGGHGEQLVAGAPVVSSAGCPPAPAPAAAGRTRAGCSGVARRPGHGYRGGPRGTCRPPAAHTPAP